MKNLLSKSALKQEGRALTTLFNLSWECVHQATQNFAILWMSANDHKNVLILGLQINFGEFINIDLVKKWELYLKLWHSDILYYYAHKRTRGLLKEGL